MVKILPVTYCSQIISVEEWRATPFLADKDRDYWIFHICGIACMQIMLTYFKRPVTLSVLLTEAIQHACFIEVGLLHAKGAALLNQRGVEAVTKRITDLEAFAPFVRDSIDRNQLLMMSVAPRLPEPSLKKGGHLIVIHGYDDRPDGLYCHVCDPSPWGAEQVSEAFPLTRLWASFSGNMIVGSESQRG